MNSSRSFSDSRNLPIIREINNGLREEKVSGNEENNCFLKKGRKVSSRLTSRKLSGHMSN